MMLTKNIADMRLFVVIAFLQMTNHVLAEIRDSVIVNKLIKVKPVGGNVAKNFVPLTEIPPPHMPHSHGQSGRRHMDDCSKKPDPRIVIGGGRVDIFGEYYDEGVEKTVVTVVIPDHIDRSHFEVTTQVPYFTVGQIDALGYHPSTMKYEHPSECEKIYQEHIAGQYSDESTDYSEESLEMARMPLSPVDIIGPSVEQGFEKMYSDFEK